MLDQWSGNKLYKGKEMQLTIFDTAGHDDLSALRPISYGGTDCFLICYAINDRNSFENASRKWLAEIKTCASLAPCILVGTKSDLRSSAQQEHEESKSSYSQSMADINNTFVSTEEMMEAAKRNFFQGAVECSAKNFQDASLNKVFLTAFKAVFQYRELKNSRTGSQTGSTYHIPPANRLSGKNEQGLNISVEHPSKEQNRKKCC